MPPTAVNKRATFDYDITERFTAGVVLTGHEAKSVKMGHCDIAGCRAMIRGEEAYITGMNIPSFQPRNAQKGYDSNRTKKLLLKKGEIAYLQGKLREGLVLLALKTYVSHGFVKIELGLGKILKKHDKREVIKKREVEREIRRVVR